MSGLVAFVGNGSAPGAEATVREISARLRHRGPDDHGILVWRPPPLTSFVEDAEGGRTPLPHLPSASHPCTVVLAVRRLALVDPTHAARQPMVSDGGGRAVILDGAIYNHQELKSRLEATGHSFRSRSDAEVILAAHAEWGSDCVERCVGMFALVLLDMERRRLLIARDRFGMKPLFHAQVDGGTLFGSELGALLHDARDLSRRANPRAVVEYLATGLTGAATETMFADVAQFPAASLLEWRPSATRKGIPTRYWNPDLTRVVDLSLEEAVRRVRDEFLRSVELHVRSDGPVGVMLSGGVDSSSIACAMRHVLGSSVDIHTFSYIGGHGAVSEEPWIDGVNAAIGATPHKLRLTPDEWSARESRSRYQGEPSASLAIFAQGRLYEESARAGVRVALSGQGCFAFGGYGRCLPARLTAMLARLQIRDAVRFLRALSTQRAADRPSVSRLLLHAGSQSLPDPVRARLWERRYWRAWIDTSYCERHDVGPSAPFHASGPFALRQAVLHGLEVGLPSLLRYEDRNAMEHSAQGRFPFISAPLVELALSLPDDYVIGPDGTIKRVLKEAMRGLVPEVVLDRRDRIGFDVPNASWATLIPEVQRLLRSARDLPPLDAPVVERLCDRVIGAEALSPVDAHTVWRLVGLADWAEDFAVDFD